MNISLTSPSVEVNFRAENNARPKVLHRPAGSPRMGLHIYVHAGSKDMASVSSFGQK